ncbi:MAG TPA: hypothetical protein DD723_09970 [Candidatus Omnitrophica bacterium]|nr:MAG: hypothetical protein A2Z81_06160 [Omnitrophica WOR_2 bacterium GWA2_45_18]HBR15844.1 hypothetical protein [Candidatus Omnitrophota bacterium]
MGSLLDHRSTTRRSLLKSSAFLLGFTSVISQIVLLRELVSVFYGNETAYAIILASWLFWVAAGSLTFSFFSRKIHRPRIVIFLLNTVVCCVLPLTVMAVRYLRPFLDIPVGVMMGLGSMCLASFVLLGPLTFILGGLFTLYCRAGEASGDPDSAGVDAGTIYFWESCGAVAGGMFFSFALIHVLSSLAAVVLLGMINLAAMIFWLERKSLGFKAGFVVLSVTGLALVSGEIGKLERLTQAASFKGVEVVAAEDSIYGHLVMTKLGKEYSLYENGLLSYTTREELSSEEQIHFPLLEHPDPGRVLLIGHGVAGGLGELLKYPQLQIDYLELDPEVVSVSQAHLPPEFLMSLKDRRVSMIYADARWFVKQTSQKYDVVIVGLPDPLTAMINRYYSLEFFNEVVRILNPKGILSLSVTSSENYLSQEAGDFLRSIHSTLKMVFTDVRSIPGDTNIFLAARESGLLTLDATTLMERLKKRGIETKYVREYYLPFKLSEDRIHYIEDVLREEGRLNTDTRPIAYLYDIVLWSTQFHTGFKKMVVVLDRIKGWHLAVIPVLILAVGWVLRCRYPSSAVSLSVMTTGFCEIIFQLIVILAFQTLYGYAYYKIGMIIASFMGGLVLGSLWARKIIAERPRQIFRIYQLTQVMICVYPLILPGLFVFFRDVAAAQRMMGIFASAFACLPVIAGLIGGLQYPLAQVLVRRGEGADPKEGGPSRSAGILYALDVVGASIGALVTGAILIPLWGINTVAFLCAGINLAVLMLLRNPQFCKRLQN